MQLLLLEIPKMEIASFALFFNEAISILQSPMICLLS